MNEVGIFTQFDPDAFLFINTAGLTNATQCHAINALVLNLKAEKLWNKLHAIYPIVGGTATTHQYNLKDPLGNIAALNLTFNGTITHNSSGMTGNGSTGWANTNYIARNHNILFGNDYNNHAISVFVGTNNNSSTYDMGCYDGSYENALIARYGTNLSYQCLNSLPSFDTVASTDSRGYWIVSRTANNVVKMYKNGDTIISGTTASADAPLYTYGLMCSNRSTPIGHTSRRNQFATIGSGLNDLEAATLYGIVRIFQIALGRNV